MPKNDTGVIQKMADTVTSVLEWIVHNYIYRSPSKMCVLRLFPYYYSVKSEGRGAPHSLIMVSQAHWPYREHPGQSGRNGQDLLLILYL